MRITSVAPPSIVPTRSPATRANVTDCPFEVSCPSSEPLSTSAIAASRFTGTSLPKFTVTWPLSVSDSVLSVSLASPLSTLAGVCRSPTKPSSSTVRFSAVPICGVESAPISKLTVAVSLSPSPSVIV